jgi:hypothetical protein
VTKGWGEVVRFPSFAFWCENQTFVFVVLGKHTPPTLFYVHVFGRPRDNLTGLAEKLETLPESSTKDSFAH